MVSYSYDHIHLRSLEPIETARYFEQMFGRRYWRRSSPTDSPGSTSISMG